MITLAKVKKNKQILEFINKTEAALKKLAYTDHGLRHSAVVSDRALAIAKELFGKDHARIARYHYLLGQVFENMRDIDKAKQHYQMALDIANKQHFDNKALITGNQKNIVIIQEHLEKL